jgi:secondary thiamine-phosphate synthase enzyme
MVLAIALADSDFAFRDLRERPGEPDARDRAAGVTRSESIRVSRESTAVSSESTPGSFLAPHLSTGSRHVHHTHYLWFETKKRQEIIDITDQVETEVKKSGIKEGFVLVSAMHISASVFVNDHESGLWEDILRWLEGTIAPWDPSRYRHNETGEDNAAAHLRSLTVGHEVIVPITAGKLDFGPWQRVFYGEWDGQRRKRVIIKVMGE